MKKLLLIFTFFALLANTELLARTRLSLDRGTMQVGGHATLPITIAKGGSANVGLSLIPQFGYFLARSFSLEGSLGLQKLSLTSDRIPWTFSLKLIAKYHFDLGGLLYPYIGLGGGFQWETQKNNMNFVLIAPVGLLIALNSYVALDFGIPMSFVFNSEGFSYAYLPVGYIGVQMFF
jgi:hypothetical protein